MRSAAPLYRAFGELLGDLRGKAGIAQQAELAALIRTTQQTVSRWEAGLSRPRPTAIPAIAQALKVNTAKLLQAAGYTPMQLVQPLDLPFPVEALSPESFERFSLHFLRLLYRGAQVHRAGASGHKQEGIDLEVTFSDGRRYTFQCKRVEEFGPQKVLAAVAAQTKDADTKVLLLSRVASPQARDAIAGQKDWQIWDKEDISARIRTLAKVDQRELVDIFFPGQRLALLGDTEPGPWQSLDAHYAPFEARKAFSHAWELVGRADEVATALAHLDNDNTQVMLLVGAGGSGKTRVLKQVIETHHDQHPGALIRFLSPTEEVTAKSLEDLGSREMVLVVDDAHDRSDLPRLFQFVASHDRTKLVLACRPYGLDYIKLQAGKFGLVGAAIKELVLPPLGLTQATALAQQVLQEFDGPAKAAEQLARMTLDCPLATVIGAQVLAKEKIHPEFIKNEDLFRSTLLGKFQDIIAGNIGSKADAEPIKKLLKVLALLQPFHPEDNALLETVHKVEGLAKHDVSRLMRLLIEAGVVFKRGSRHRLSPDLLADHIIETACVGPGDTSTGYAELVFDAAHDRQVAHLLLSLGKLDWLRSNRIPTNSKLLTGVWSKLKPSRDYGDPHVQAVTDVAYYQPKLALDFAERLMRDQDHLRELPELIKYAAYNYAHLPRACQYLWQLGKDDSRPLHQHPHHPIRILAEMCSVQPDKPVEYNERVVEFGLSLLLTADAWQHIHTPFDFLEGALRADGHTTTSKGHLISFRNYGVNHTFIATLRAKVIDAAIELLSAENVPAAVQAGHFLEHAFRPPMHGSLEDRGVWEAEFTETIAKLAAKVRRGDLDPLVLIEVFHNVAWWANHGSGPTATAAKSLLKLQPKSIEYRTLLALIDGYANLLIRRTDQKAQKRWQEEQSVLAAELLAAYPNGEALRTFIEACLARIERNSPHRKDAAHALYWRLLKDNNFARATVEHALSQPEALTNRFADMAMAEIMAASHDDGLQVARRFLASEHPKLQRLVGRGYSALRNNSMSFTAADQEVLRTLLKSNDELTVLNAGNAIRTVAMSNDRLAIDLVAEANFAISEFLADHLLMLFTGEDWISLKSLTEEDVARILAKLQPLPEIEGHWIETFLAHASKHCPWKCVEFFKARVERAANAEDWSIKPCHVDSASDVRLRFRESSEFAAILRDISQWMKSRPDNNNFKYFSAELFNAMFAPFDDVLVGALKSWLEVATQDDLEAINRILQTAPPEFVFSHRDFAVLYLERAAQFDPKSLDKAHFALYHSATTGLRSGVVGEPFPRDVAMKEGAQKALQEVPRFSPAYTFFEELKEHAERNIERSLKEAEDAEE